MKALFLKNSSSKPTIVEIPVPSIVNKQILIKVEYVGICKTDAYVANNLLPHADNLILGHECSGIVVGSKAQNSLLVIK